MLVGCARNVPAVPVKDQQAAATLVKLPRDFATDVDRFFSTYHRAEGNEFRLVGVGGIDEAVKLVKKTTLSGSR
jgi:inorganic pyrophosphatase